VEAVENAGPWCTQRAHHNEIVEENASYRRPFVEAFSLSVTPGKLTSHRKQHGQLILDNGITRNAVVEVRLRAWLRNTNKRFGDAKTLNPKQVAVSRRDIGRTYIFYSQLSSDAAHPSVTALNRYVIPHTINEVGGIDVEPIVADEEIEETLELLCQAVMGVCVGVNQMLGGTRGGGALNGLAEEYVALSNKSASKVA
jgi:hypothetical protein